MRTPTMIAALLFTLAGVAQGPLSLSLEQALKLAGEQSYAVRSSALEAEKAQRKVKEITATGLPQINGSAGVTNFIDVPTQLIPNFFGEPGQGPAYIPVQFGVPWSANGSLSLNQLLFDGSYIVGLQATRTIAENSRIELEKTRADAINQAAKAYYGVLAAEEGVRLVSEGIPLLEKSIREVTAMKEAGFMEQIDVDRLQIQLDQVQAQRAEFEKQGQVARMLLALTLGVPQGTPLQLTDGLTSILDDPNETALSEVEFVPETHVEQTQAENLLRLQELNKRNEKAKAMPSLGAFLQHQQVWNGPTFDPGGTYRFYPTTLWGVNLNVPIFSSGMRHQRVKQADLAIEQLQINKTATEQRLRTMAEQARTTVRTAADNLRTQERSLVLAKTIFDRTTVKFNLGSAASFELTQEQGNHLQAQQLYVQRLYALLTARADLRKALDLY